MVLSHFHEGKKKKIFLVKCFQMLKFTVKENSVMSATIAPSRIFKSFHKANA